MAVLVHGDAVRTDPGNCGELRDGQASPLARNNQPGGRQHRWKPLLKPALATVYHDNNFVIAVIGTTEASERIVVVGKRGKDDALDPTRDLAVDDAVRKRQLDS